MSAVSQKRTLMGSPRFGGRVRKGWGKNQLMQIHDPIYFASYLSSPYVEIF